MTVKAQVKLIDSLRLVSRMGTGPVLIIDGTDSNGGANPMQLLLMADAGCTANDVI